MDSCIKRTCWTYYFVNILPKKSKNFYFFKYRNANEPVPIRIHALTTVFDKYLWFKMTDQVTNIGQIILETLENLIHIDLNSINEDEFISKHATMKQNAVKSIFEHFLSDQSIDGNLANHCYRILQEVIN